MAQLPYVNDTYRTAPRHISWFARAFPSLTFHSQWIATILRSCMLAKRARYGDQEWIDSSLEVLRSLESVGVQFEIDGLNHLRQLETPCLIIGNHMSSLETTVLPCLIQPLRRITFVVKESLLNYPFFKHVMRSRDPIPVSQTDARQDFKAMLDGGTERLAQGISLVIFPQGQRAAAFDPAKFNTIGIKLAKRAGVPIIPLALHTSAWSIGRIVSEFGKIKPAQKVRFSFGAPLIVNGRGTDAHEATLQFITRNLQEWEEEDRQSVLAVS